MQYTTLGRTGLSVSRLGFGAMRLPMQGDTVDRELAVPMIRRAFEAGVTYIDTAMFYCNEDSQRVVGEALKGWRERVVLSTKNNYFAADEKTWWTNLENSLERLDVQNIDIYNTHGINADVYEQFVLPHILKWMEKAKDQGLIKHLCTSFHGTREFFRRMVDDGFYESVTLQYNLLNRDFEDEIAYAKAAGMGIVVMGPVGGGRLVRGTGEGPSGESSAGRRLHRLRSVRFKVPAGDCHRRTASQRPSGTFGREKMNLCMEWCVWTQAMKNSADNERIA